ncbi:MAG: NFACT RNA binding domain-containing protein [Candidatus Micrarchaeota archaeon]
MRAELDLDKTVEQNAERYFELGKKFKKKLKGLESSMAPLQKELQKARQTRALCVQSKKAPVKRKREWFEKFRWFKTTDDFLVIGGRDAKSNEQVVKKFLDDSDLYFHADVLGAPHCALKTKKNSAPIESKKEAAVFAAIFSRAWQSGTTAADGYGVLPEQVSKKAVSGEFLSAGAFMIYGEREWYRKIALRCGIGIEKIGDDWRVISGPVSAVKKHAAFFVEIRPGKTEKGDLSKKLFRFFLFKAQNSLGSVSLDDFIAALPTGESDIVTQH